MRRRWKFDNLHLFEVYAGHKFYRTSYAVGKSVHHTAKRVHFFITKLPEITFDCFANSKAMPSFLRHLEYVHII